MNKFLILILFFVFCGCFEAAHADLFHAGGSYSRQYSGFGFDPYINNRLPDRKNYNRPELGLYGQAAAENRQQIGQTGLNMQMAPIPWRNKNLYVD